MSDTKHPLNRCRDCRHRWYPRGSHLSRRCPACQSERVAVVIEEPPEAIPVARPAYRPAPPPRQPKGALLAVAVGVAGLLFVGCCGGLMLTPSSRTSGDRQAGKKEKGKGQGDAVVGAFFTPQTDKPADQGEPFQPKMNHVKADPPQVKQEAPSPAGKDKKQPAEEQPAGPAREEVTLTPAGLRIGQLGGFKEGAGGSAMPSTVIEIVSPSVALVRARGEDFLLSGIRTDNLVPDKALFLRGKWEVVGLADHRGRKLYEVTYLSAASEVAERIKQAKEQAVAKEEPKAAPGNVQPLYPTEDQVRAQAGSKGGSVQVKGYYRSNGTYVAPHSRSSPGGGRR